MSTKTHDWQTIGITFIIATVIFGAVSAVGFYQVTLLANEKANLQSQYNTLKTLDDSNIVTIAALRAQISSLQANLNADTAQITNLQGKLASLEAANVTAIFHYTYSNPGFLGCFLSCTATLIDVTYANLGTVTAIDVSITVTFYDSSGIQLCSVTQPLAMILLGHSISTLNGLSNQCNYNHKAALDPVLTTARVTWS